MHENQDWVAAFEEISAIITEKIPEIKFVDLWAGQADSPGDEYPFALPAVFIEFNAVPEDLGNNVQNLTTDIKIRLLYIPSDDTFDGSRLSLGEFGLMLRKIYRTFHGKGGDNFSQMFRTGLNRERAMPYEWHYSQTFRCNILDYAACPQYDEGTVEELNISRGTPPFAQDNTFDIPV